MARVTGSVITVSRKGGDVFYLKARDRAGRQIKHRLGPVHEGRGKPEPGHWTRKQADDALREFLTDLGRTPDSPADSVTFDDAVRAWLHYIETDRKRRPSTLRDYRSAVTRWLEPEFGGKPIRSISADDIEDWRIDLVAAGELSDRTINKLLTMLHGIFKRAQRVHGLPVNPATGADRQPGRSHGDIDVLDPGEIALLASHASSDQDAAFYTVAAFTGLRLGEMLALRWRDIDFSKRLVHVRWSYVQGHEDRPKSHRVRSVPLTDQVARALDGLSRRDDWTGDDDLVFPSIVGEHIDASALRRRFKAALKRAGLRELRVHDLRHSFGSLAVQRMPLADVKAYMGHAHIETTMVYVHHTPQHDAADKLSTLISGYQVGTETRTSDRNGAQLSATELAA
jgi:integrase